MAKKRQLRELLIVTDTKGTKQAANELEQLDKALKGAASGGKDLGGVSKGLSKSLERLYQRAQPLSSALDKSAKSVQALNRALNADTASATKKLSAYMDNLELVGLSLNSIEADAKGAFEALDKANSAMSGGSISASRLQETLDSLDATMEALLHTVIDVEENTGKTSKRIKQARDSMQGLGTSSERAAKGLEGVARTGGRTGKQMSKMARAASGLAAIYASVAATMFALSEAYRLLDEAFDRSRFRENIQPQLVIEYGGALRSTAASMVEFGLASEDALRKSAKASSMGLNAEQMEKIVSIAKKASAVLGRDFSESLDRLTLGIAKQERELLDEFGILIGLEEAQRKYANSVGKTITQLTSFEKQQAFANAVTEQGLEKYGQFNVELTHTERILRDVKTNYEALTAAITASDSAGAFIVGILGDVANFTMMLGREALGVSPISVKYRELQLAIENLNKATDAETIAKTSAEVEILSKEFRALYDSMNEVEILLRTSDTAGLENILRVSGDARDGLEGTNEDLVKLTQSIRKESKGIIEVWEASKSRSKNPFLQVTTSLGKYVELLDIASERSDQFAEATNDSLQTMQTALGLNRKEALELIDSFNRLNELRIFGGLERDIASLKRQEGSQKDIEDQIALVRDLETEVDLMYATERDLEEIKKKSLEAQKQNLILKRMERDLAAETLKLAEDQRTAESRQRVSEAASDRALVGLDSTETFKNSQAIREKTLDIEAKQAQLAELRNKNYAENSLQVQTLVGELRILQSQLDVLEEGTGRAGILDIANSLGDMANIPGLTDLQSTFLGISSTLTEETFNMFESFGTNLEAFIESSVASAEALGQAGLAIYQEMSSAKIASIDREIAAEKRRDGKSAESLAKIKKLEAKKIKEEAKSKKASVAISTATAIMKGYADLGPIAGTAAAVAMAALGAYQLSAIDKAANGQLAALDGGSGDAASITAGNRDNAIDTSRAASAGEYAFITGGSGNWKGPGRAGGGEVGAGTSFIAGERGPEIITPTVPVSVSDASDSSGGSKIVFAPVFNAHAVDSVGMGEMFQNYSKELYDGLEEELRARNLTLESLER